MLINIHSYYSLRYGTIPMEALVDLLYAYGYTTAVLTDINNTSGTFEFIRLCKERGIKGLAGVEFRQGDTLLYIGIARNKKGFQELNETISEANLQRKPLPETAPEYEHAFVVYPYGTKQYHDLRDHEYIGIAPRHLSKLWNEPQKHFDKYVIWSPVTFASKKGYDLHKKLRAIDNNILLSQLHHETCADASEQLLSRKKLLEVYEQYPALIYNTNKLLDKCDFDFDFTTQKNKQIFTNSKYDDKQLLEKLAFEGMRFRYGENNREAYARVRKELDIIDTLGFSSYFLITWDIVRYGMSRGFYHVGRGSGANSVVAYCLKITDVCPIELDLYFERFLNPKRKSPPDFDIDFSWDERDDMYDYIFKRYGTKHVALMGAMSTFGEKSIIRELGKVYGLPKADIDRIIDEPESVMNKNEITELIVYMMRHLNNYPNLRTIHSSGVLISDEPITAYTALDLPPKGLPTAQFDMYASEEIGFEKFDILSQRGIGHIKEAAQIIWQNRRTKVDVHDVEKFKTDPNIHAQLESGDTIGCFYVESPAMRQLLKKLKCKEYLTLVAASSIIRPGVASSGMMKAYIERFHDPQKTVYLHPVMEEQLQETFGVMVYQEDVLKVGHYFGGLDLADADVLRRMMSGKGRSAKHLLEIKEKYFANCTRFGYPEHVAREVWRQMESFAGYSFSKAHSASFAVESFQSLYLKTYFPLEFMVAVINNFGGFYNTKVYVQEARKAGGIIHLPCVNKSKYTTTLEGKDIYLGLVHVKNLETEVAKKIIDERLRGGDYTSLENILERTSITLEQLIVLIRLGALRFTGKNKKELLWDAYTLANRKEQPKAIQKLFASMAQTFTLPKFEIPMLEDLYDEVELLRFPVSGSYFDLVEGEISGVLEKGLTESVGKNITIFGDFITAKYVPTKRKELMAFGCFFDKDGNFFDTTHFPQSFSKYNFKGNGIYEITGKIVEDFGFPSIEVDTMKRLPIQADPRTE